MYCASESYLDEQTHVHSEVRIKIEARVRSFLEAQQAVVLKAWKGPAIPLEL